MVAEGEIMQSRLRVPEHVVYRSFGEETVVVNLRSGKYHGLNPTAARMLDVLSGSPTVEDGVRELTREFGGVEEQRIRSDVLALCQSLLDRELVELGDPDG